MQNFWKDQILGFSVFGYQIPKIQMEKFYEINVHIL